MRLLLAIITAVGLSGCVSQKGTVLRSDEKLHVPTSVHGIGFRSGFHGELVKLYYCGKLILCKKLTTNGSTSSAWWVEIKDYATTPEIRVVVEAGGSKLDSDKDPVLRELYMGMRKDVNLVAPIPIKPKLHGRLFKEFQFDWKLGPVVDVWIENSQLNIQQFPTMEPFY